MSKIRVKVVFDDPICNIGSALDGQFLSDIIQFEESESYANSLLLDAIPNAGESIELWSHTGAHHFTVIAVHHVATGKYPQYVKLLLNQISIRDIPPHHWTNL